MTHSTLERSQVGEDPVIVIPSRAVNAPHAPSPGFRCNLCGAAGEPWLEKRGYPILRCPRCDNAFVPQDRVPADLEAVYSEGYFEGKEATGYPSYLADRRLLENNFADRARWIDQLGAPGPRLLEVGAAYGLFLAAARDRGFQVTGVELVPECVEAAARLEGVRIVQGDFLKTPLEGPFDVIAMFDVIEHFRDPMACLRRARDLLSPGGLLVIETDDLAAPWARLLGRHWYFLDPPQHLFYFSAKGMKGRLREAGFSGPIRIRRPGRRVSLRNIAFKLTAAVPPGPARRSLASVARRARSASVYLNFGDAMLVAARRDG